MTSPYRAPSWDKCRRISTKETAKLVRLILKQCYPDVTFSVRMEKYAGGSSITVAWTDGPTEKDIRVRTKMFEGSCVDYTDAKVFHDVIMNGEWVHFSPELIWTVRHITPEFAKRARTSVLSKLPEDQHPTGIRFDHEFVYSYSETEPKGSVLLTSMILENDGRHPAFSLR